MVKKINVLILASVIGFLAFSAIQAYLINNTYKLKKDAFLNETRRSISRLDDFSPILDSINDIWQDRFLVAVSEYEQQKLTRDSLLSQLKKETQELDEDYRIAYKAEMKNNGVVYDLQFHKRVRTIILLDSIQNDTLFYSEPAKDGFRLIGDDFKREDGHRISNSLWLTDHTYQVQEGDSTVSKSYDLQFETVDVMNIDGWKRIVLNQLKGLLIISISIFLFVFGLLYYSIKNLITQKKIADIKTDFVNNITHELKTPLATLSLATKMMKKDAILESAEIVKSTIGTIERQNIRLQKLIDQVLHNSLGYTEIQLNKETTNSATYLSQIISDFEIAQADKDLTLTKEWAPSSPEITIDKFYITTAIVNILENAVKYGGTQIKVSTRLEGKDFIIAIQDNGQGISSKDKKSIFDKFYRAGNKEIHDVKGLGLGLYYTHQVIMAHGGEIRVDSKVGSGSTFTIHIPK
ncbi:MAG: HAMP domain-containing histidine kinase [Flavobacteriaceae bacterium]|nr:HAMP domain-containing histidine kinase [Flavobacteriaceae bacterium]